MRIDSRFVKRIRKEFPAADADPVGRRRAFLDNGAGTLVTMRSAEREAVARIDWSANVGNLFPESVGAEGSEGGEQAGSRQAGSQGGAGGGGASGAGPGSIPPDIPDGSDDDVVARQIREAAMKETDPELRKALWDEYRKYKKGQ